MPSILIHAVNVTTEKLLLPMVEATTTTAIPISKTTTAIITRLSGGGGVGGGGGVTSSSGGGGGTGVVGSSGGGPHGQSKRPTIIIYPTGKCNYLFYLLIRAIRKMLQFGENNLWAVYQKRIHLNIIK